MNLTHIFSLGAIMSTTSVRAAKSVRRPGPCQCASSPSPIVIDRICTFAPSLLARLRLVQSDYQTWGGYRAMSSGATVVTFPWARHSR